MAGYLFGIVVALVAGALLVAVIAPYLPWLLALAALTLVTVVLIKR